MELDIKIGSASLSIPIDKPFQLELDSMMNKIEAFASSKGVDLGSLDIKGLIPMMVKGIAGCEKGCPADAKGLVSRGVSDFDAGVYRRRHPLRHSKNNRRYSHLLKDVSGFLMKNVSPK